jgi:transposase-like protein
MDERGLCCIRLLRAARADHGALKRLIDPTRGFKTLPTASAAIKGFEVMRVIRKRQCFMLESGAMGAARFVNRLFRLAA